MKWYDDLYVGESIVHKTNKIKWKIRHNAGQINIYVITLASGEKNLLDIIPSHELLLFMISTGMSLPMVVTGLSCIYKFSI